MTSETQNQTTSSSTEMLEGVRILIDRMESSPEDFVVDPHSMHLQTTPKFHFVARALEEALYGEANPTAFIHLTAEERTALLIAYRKMMRQAFTAQVIARTFAEKDENDTQDKVYSVPMRGYGKAVAKHPGMPVAYEATANAQINPWK
jgi:hypothetical protein